jgi:hypothetical protein
MNCTVEQRNRARRVIEELGDRSEVIETDLLSPALDPSGRWAIEVSLESDGLPPGVLRTLGEAEMTIRFTGPRQSKWHCVAVV